MVRRHGNMIVTDQALELLVTVGYKNINREHYQRAISEGRHLCRRE
jgi:hypothetical protein